MFNGPLKIRLFIDIGRLKPSSKTRRVKDNLVK